MTWKKNGRGRTMQVRVKVENDTEIVKYVKVKLSPTEYLVINKAMKHFAKNESENAEDRKIMERMLEVKPTYKYMKAAEADDGKS
jgi:predicted class III extradiol MEMO1 family dioxygenase